MIEIKDLKKDDVIHIRNLGIAIFIGINKEHPHLADIHFEGKVTTISKYVKCERKIV